MLAHQETEGGITFSLEVTTSMLPIEGNLASTLLSEDDLRDRLEQGDSWAWANVTVVAKCNRVYGHGFLSGTSSCASTESFMASGFYEELKETALLDLEREIEREKQYLEEGAKMVQRLIGRRS